MPTTTPRHSNSGPTPRSSERKWAMTRRVLLLAVCSLAFSREAVAKSDLKAPFSVESAQVLPAGIGSPRILDLFLSANTRYGEDGSLEPLGKRLNKAVKWQDVIDVESDATQKKLIQSILNDLGFPLTGSP